jgi:23S rRNA (uracil1939-C5)-methyltransferase
VLSVGRTLPLVIEKPAVGGRMIARVDGQVVLVSGAIPGERVLARVERVSRRVAYAETVAVEEPSPDRRAVDGDPLCGGALYSHIAYERQLAIKSAVIADALARIGRISAPAPLAVMPSPELGYRMRARVHVRGRQIGFFREATHDICDVATTRQLLPATCDVLNHLHAALQSLGADAVRELELTENADASHRAVAVELAADIDRRAIERLAATEGLTGFVSPFGVHGQPYVVDTLQPNGAVVSLRRHVLAFFQGNRYLLRAFVGRVLALVPADRPLVDLYAGVGLFAVTAAVTHGMPVTAVEGERYAATDLAANAAGHGVRVVHESVEAFTAAAAPDQRATIIVDPPRSGMSREALDGAVRLTPGRIVYVSCDVATLARDARRLLDAGYSVTGADAFDLFPNTPHVETIVLFDRSA